MGAATTLIGDIGGTNCRLALARDGRLLDASIATYSYGTHPSLVAAIRAYLQAQRTQVEVACLAIAGPVTGDAIKFTNNAWHFSIAQTRADLNLGALDVINDFEAIALALPHLRPQQLEQIGGGEPRADSPRVALGSGTGYGSAQVVVCGDAFVALPSEAGHVSLGPATARELTLFSWLLQEGIEITREQLLSGPGLERIYRGLCAIDGASAEPCRAAEIQTRAVAGSDPRCVAALDMFCDLLGSAARDQALGALALGGVYIAGGIVRRFIPFLRAGGFRRRFESSATMRALLEPIPVYVVTEDNPGLVGAAARAAARRP